MLITSQLFAVNFIESEYDLTVVHDDARTELENTISLLHKKLPFQVNQDLAFLRHRISKRPKFINREDEIPYIRHDVFLINELEDELYSYKQEEQVQALLRTFKVLKEQCQIILENHDSISK